MGSLIGVPAALRALRRALESVAAPYMIIGGIAVVARGVARTTRDVDVTVPGELSTPALLGALAAHGIEPRIPDALAFSRRTHVLLLRHVRSEVEVDLTLAWAPFEIEALQRAERLTIGRVRVPVARPEDLVVYKLIGGRPLDLTDLAELVALHGTKMDQGRLLRLAAEVADALDDPGRLATLRTLLGRVSDVAE